MHSHIWALRLCRVALQETSRAEERCFGQELRPPPPSCIYRRVPTHPSVLETVLLISATERMNPLSISKNRSTPKRGRWGGCVNAQMTTRRTTVTGKQPVFFPIQGQYTTLAFLISSGCRYLLVMAMLLYTDVQNISLPYRTENRFYISVLVIPASA